MKVLEKARLKSSATVAAQYPTPKKSIKALTAGFRDLRGVVGDEYKIQREQSKSLTQLERVASKSSDAISSLTEKLLSKGDELLEAKDEALTAQKGLEDAEDGLTFQSTRARKYHRLSKSRAQQITRMKETGRIEKEKAIKACNELEEMETDFTLAAAKDEEISQGFKDQIIALENVIEKLEAELLDTRLQIEEQKHILAAKCNEYEEQIREMNNKIVGMEISIERWRIEEEANIQDIDTLTEKLYDSNRTIASLNARLNRAQEVRNKLEDYKALVQRTLQLKEKGVYTPSVRCIVRQSIVRGCPMKNIGAIFDCFYQRFMKPLIDPSVRIEKILLDKRTARRHVEEGKVASMMQMVVEWMRSPCKDASS